LSDNLHPIRGYSEKGTCNDTVIKSPLNDLKGWKAENNLSDKTNEEGIVNVSLCDIIVVGKGFSVSIEKSKTNRIPKSNQAIS
jgi:hypothetical protein